MAATHYQIFYRYVSPDTNVPITNDLSNEYKETLEIVHQKHKLYNGTTSEQLEAEQDLNNMIIEQTTPATCSKYDMMFAFNGAKKYYHRNWKNGRWTDEITAIPDGIVTLKEYGGDQILHEYRTGANNAFKINEYNETTTPLPKRAVTADNYDFKDTKTGTYYKYSGYIVPGNAPKVFLANAWTKELPDVVTKPTDDEIRAIEGYPGVNPTYVKFERMDNGGRLTIKPGEYEIENGDISVSSLGNFDKLRTENIVQLRIDNGLYVDRIKPESYALQNDCAYPYVVKDSYSRIPMSPWIKGSTHGSLEAAVEKCRILVGMIGMENIKLVKIVDIRQKIRIN